jgi:hypothetical protein
MCHQRLSQYKSPTRTPLHYRFKLQYWTKAPTKGDAKKLEKGEKKDGDADNVWDRAPAFLADEEDEGEDEEEEEEEEDSKRIASAEGLGFPVAMTLKGGGDRRGSAGGEDDDEEDEGVNEHEENGKKAGSVVEPASKKQKNGKGKLKSQKKAVSTKKQEPNAKPGAIAQPSSKEPGPKKGVVPPGGAKRKRNQ